MLDAFLAEEKMPEEYLDQTQVLYLSIYLYISTLIDLYPSVS